MQNVWKICEEHKKKKMFQCGGSQIANTKNTRILFQCGVPFANTKEKKMYSMWWFSIHKKNLIQCGRAFLRTQQNKATCIQCESQICRICKSKMGNRKYDKLCVTCAIQEDIL